jgi:hypothetical protein
VERRCSRASRCAEREVLLQHARVEIVIAGLIELKWINKDTRYYDRAASPLRQQR